MPVVPPLSQESNVAPDAGLQSRYRTLGGGVDEMLGSDGRMRAVWEKFVAMLDALPSKDLAARFARADQYLQDAGVFYRVYDETAARERAWPLSPLPVLIDEDEWADIGEGLVQRAEVLEWMLADLHGEQILVRDGLLPPELVAANPGFLRPLVGIPPRGGHYLHFLAFDLGRGPDGRWWVLGDRTQAPSGAGFALENRVATIRAFPDLPAGVNVHRLAGFFRRFRDALLDMAGQRASGVGILTPGPNNETYYEHAWIARYLGFLLLEGEDLTVRNGQTLVRTVSGLQPVSVLWRRLDAAFMDPLELRADSWIGTPGLVGALRAGSLDVVNALGAGILETRAFAAFLPGIGKALLGEELKLPGIATWWCGQESARAEVIAGLERMMIGPAYSTVLPYDDPQSTLLGAQLDPDEKQHLLKRLRGEGGRWVAQEAVTLSTTPAYVGRDDNGRLEPRPFVLRAFAARTQDGWTIMPGGFARVGAQADTRAIAMQFGGQAADVWIVSPNPVSQETLLASGDVVAPQEASALPSRAAENLLWLGRYTERSESVARVLRAYHARVAENRNQPLPLLATLEALLTEQNVDAKQPLPPGLLDCINGAATSAGRIRDRFSPDGWSALRDLQNAAQRAARKTRAGDDASRIMTELLRKLAGFSGLLHENMYRSDGWRFLEIGRRIERGIQIAQLLAALRATDAPPGLVQATLEIGDSVMTHRNRFGVHSGVASVVDLLALDARNPRSLMFQLDVLREEFAQLPLAPSHAGMSAFAKEALRLHTNLSIREAVDLGHEDLLQFGNDIAGLYDQIAAAYFG